MSVLYIPFGGIVEVALRWDEARQKSRGQEGSLGKSDEPELRQESVERKGGIDLRNFWEGVLITNWK